MNFPEVSVWSKNEKKRQEQIEGEKAWTEAWRAFMIHDASLSREEGLFQTHKQLSGLSGGNVLYLDQLTGKRKGQPLSVGGGGHTLQSTDWSTDGQTYLAPTVCWV